VGVGVEDVGADDVADDAPELETTLKVLVTLVEEEIT